MLEARIQQQFFESADLVYQLADGLARPVADAAQAVVACLTSGGRLLACGQGGGQALAQWFSAALMWRFERPRPALAALALCGVAQPPFAHQALAAEPGQAQLLQLRALAQPGDLLLVCSGRGDDAELAAVIREAHAKELSVLLLCAPANEGGGLAALLQETDLWIPVPHERLPRVHELQLLVLHALCDAIDLQLLGDADAA